MARRKHCLWTPPPPQEFSWTHLSLSYSPRQLSAILNVGKVLESQLYPNKNKHTDLSQAEHHGGPSSSLGVQDKTRVHVHWVKTDRVVILREQQGMWKPCVEPASLVIGHGMLLHLVSHK